MSRYLVDRMEAHDRIMAVTLVHTYLSSLTGARA
jgi:prephenate dehydrogenase